MASQSNRPTLSEVERQALTAETPRRGPNTVQAEQPRERKPVKRERGTRAAQENSIRVSGVRSKKPSQLDNRSQAPRDQGAPAESDSQALPGHIKERYIQVGNQYHFPNGDPAFRDRGARLATKSENTEVIRDLIAIAEERGWKSVTVNGTDRFRKEAWQQAKLAGLSVRGYRPSEIEQAQLVRLMDRERNKVNELRGTDSVGREVERTPTVDPETRPELREPVVPVDERVYRGRLVDHGRANYQHDREANLSYFVKIDTPAGERILWGKDLERAIKESLSQVKPGDEVAVRHLGEKPVTVVRATRDAQGTVTGQAAVATYRNRWLVESREFLERRAEVARVVRDPTLDPRQVIGQRPELAGTYRELRAAELVAKELYADHRDRERFVTRVRDAIAEEIERGQPLSVMRVREPIKERDRVRSPSLDRTERVLS